MNLTIIVPALDAAETLAATLACFDGAEEVIVVDGGSVDETLEIAQRCGARTLQVPRSRGAQLAAGAASASGEWLLFIHADTQLELGWRNAVTEFIESADNRSKAAAFRFALDDGSAQARRLEKIVRWRSTAVGLPYGDQGLLIHAGFYREIGGFRPLPIMEDVDLVLRIGRNNIVVLPAIARTSAKRWRKSGWMRRSAHNVFCLTLYFLGVPPRLIARIYG